jgi:Arc/MetJ family transcription regulator
MKETRTNIVLDDELVAKAMAKAGVRTKKAAIEQALRAYIREPDWEGLLALEGSHAVADDYDPAELFKDDPGLKLVAEPLAHHKAGRGVAAKSPSKRAAKRRGK